MSRQNTPAIDLVVEEPARLVLSRVDKWSAGAVDNGEITDPELLIAAHAVAAKKAKELLKKKRQREYGREWAKNHPEEVAAGHLSWRKDNPDKVAKYRLDNLEVARARFRKWAKKNPEKVRERARKYRANKKAKALKAKQ